MVKITHRERVNRRHRIPMFSSVNNLLFNSGVFRLHSIQEEHSGCLKLFSRGACAPGKMFVSFILLTIFTLLFSQNLFSQQAAKESNTVLVLSSYMSDSRRVNDFIADFEKTSREKGLTLYLLMENLNFKGFEGSGQWKKQMKDALKKHYSNDLRCLIILGQEAWGTFLSLDTIPPIPFSGCYISKNGTLLTDSLSPNPRSINMELLSMQKGAGSGIINVYDVDTNVKLILNLFPKTKNIAFLSDNSYGGVSMKSLVRDYFAQSTLGLNLITLDGRIDNIFTIAEKIMKLPPNTVLLMGTWRVDNSGLYFLQSTLENLISKNDSLPVISLSGLGEGSMAIGGYYPKYQSNVKFIVEKIEDYYNGITS